MANVVVTHFSGILIDGIYQSSCFYDGIIAALIDEGHNVLHIITSDFLAKPWGGANKPYTNSEKERVNQEVKAFKPDLIISFNNSSIAGLEDTVDCPIAVWDADSFVFFNDKENLLKKQDRYCFLAFSNKGLADYEENIDSKHAVKARIPSATHIKNKETEKRYNISFIGNAFLNSPNLQSFLKNHPEFVNISEEDLNSTPELDFAICKARGISKSELLFQSCGVGRASAILNLLDYGVTAFGNESWLSMGGLDSRIFKAFDPSLVFTLNHNELIYNRSIISLNASHKQNVTGYPWRVLDIMASSSVLLSDYKSDLANDFPHIQFPFYDSTFDLLDLTKKLLEDKMWCTDYMLQCNDAVDAGFRWKHRFPLIAQVTGVDLKKGEGQGAYRRLEGKQNQIITDIFAFILARLEARTKPPKQRAKKNAKGYLPDFLKIRLINAYMSKNSKGKKIYE